MWLSVLLVAKTGEIQQILSNRIVITTLIVQVDKKTTYYYDHMAVSFVNQIISNI